MSNDYLYELLESGSMTKKEFDFCVKYGLVDLDVIEENLNFSSIHDAKSNIDSIKHSVSDAATDAISYKDHKNLINKKQPSPQNASINNGKKKVVLKTEPTEKDKNDEEHIKLLKGSLRSMAYRTAPMAFSTMGVLSTYKLAKDAEDKIKSTNNRAKEILNGKKSQEVEKSDNSHTQNSNNSSHENTSSHESGNNDSEHGDAIENIKNHALDIAHKGKEWATEHGINGLHVTLGALAAGMLAKGGYHLYKHMRFKKKTKPTFDEAHKAATESLKKTHPELAVHADKEIRNDVNKVITANKDNFKDNHEDTHKMIVNHFKSDKYKQELANRFNQNKK